MPKAIWKETVLSDSADTIVVEGNHYFPADSINCEYFRESSGHTVCPWKGKASYYDLVVGDEVNEQAAWYYPDPSPAAAKTKPTVTPTGPGRAKIRSIATSAKTTTSRRTPRVRLYSCSLKSLSYGRPAQQALRSTVRLREDSAPAVEPEVPGPIIPFQAVRPRDCADG